MQQAGSTQEEEQESLFILEQTTSSRGEAAADVDSMLFAGKLIGDMFSPLSTKGSTLGGGREGAWVTHNNALQCKMLPKCNPKCHNNGRKCSRCYSAIPTMVQNTCRPCKLNFDHMCTSIVQLTKLQTPGLVNYNAIMQPLLFSPL